MPPKVEAKKDDKKAGGKGGKAGKGGATKKIVVRVPIGVRRKERKSRFRANFVDVINNYKNVVVVNIDNVGSQQIQVVRMKLRSFGAVMVVGKNTVVRPLIRDAIKAGNTKLEALLTCSKNNVAFIFTNSSDLAGIRDIVTANKVPAAAKTGTFAPSDVHIPPGPTPLDPGQTSFFQALNISTKITRGAIEIVNAVHLIRVGERVSASAVALLGKLNIRPFFYGITVVKVYEDGFVYDASVLDISKADIYNKFVSSIEAVRFVSLAAKQLNTATVGNAIVKAHNVLAKIALAIDYSFPSVQKLRAAFGLANPFADSEEAAEEEAAGSAKSGSGSGSGSGSSSGSGSD